MIFRISPFILIILYSPVKITGLIRSGNARLPYSAVFRGFGDTRAQVGALMLANRKNLA